MRQSVFRVITIGSVLLFALGCAENIVPVIDELTIPEIVEAGPVEFQVVAHDLDDDTLTYTWRVGDKMLSSTTPSATWIAPDVDTIVTVEVRVNDGGDKPAIRTSPLRIISTQSLINRVLEERWRIGYMTEDLELYLSAFWAEGFLYSSDMGTPNNPDDDVTFDDIRDERDSAVRVFRRFNDIEIEISAPEITIVSEDRAIARDHYRIQGFVAEGDSLEGGFIGWFSEGDNEFTFERRRMADGRLEWRITQWIDKAFSEEEIRAANNLAPSVSIIRSHFVNGNLRTILGAIKL